MTAVGAPKPLLSLSLIFFIGLGVSGGRAAEDPEAGWSPVSPAYLAQAGGGAEGSQTTNEWKLRLTAGYDDNPAKLNSSIIVAPDVAPTSALVALRLGHRMEHKASATTSFFGEAQYRTRRYTGAADVADRSDVTISAGLTDQTLRTDSSPIRLTVGGTFGWRDLTFINNNTGRAVPGLEDRFDSLRYELFVKVRVPRSKSSQLRTDFVIRYQDYIEDYLDLGQEALDYTQFDLSPGYQWVTGGGTRLRVTGHYGYRMYASRRADDLTGTPIDGTSLNYHYFGAKAHSRSNVSGSATAGLSTGVERRVDSEVGFNNRTTFSVGGTLGYDINRNNRFSANLTYEYREYDHLDGGNVSTTNDGGRKRQGYRLFLTYLSRKAILGADAFARYQRESFTNSDLIYEYDRNVYTVGVRARF